LYADHIIVEQIECNVGIIALAELQDDLLDSIARDNPEPVAGLPARGGYSIAGEIQVSVQV
jgi:hypothetical protein